MNVSADCKGIPPDGNFKHLGQTYMMPRQYEADWLVSEYNHKEILCI
jgi:hypothetical protein